MNPQEKMAWYMLAVLLLAAVAFLALWTLSGHSSGAGGAFGLLGLLGFTGSFVSGKKGRVMADENDQLISLKAGRVAFVIFWLYFVAYCVLMNFPFNTDPMVPSGYFSRLLLTSLYVMIATNSIAILAYYRADTTEADTLVDRFRKMAAIRKAGLAMALMSLFVMTPFFYTMNRIGPGIILQVFGYTTCAALLLVYYVFWHQLASIAITSGMEAEVPLIRKRGDITLLLGVVGSAGATVVGAVVSSDTFFLDRVPRILFYAICAGILGLGFSAFMSKGEAER